MDFTEHAQVILDEFGKQTFLKLASMNEPLECKALFEKQKQTDWNNSQGILEAELKLSVLKNTFERTPVVNEEIKINEIYYNIISVEITESFLILELNKAEV